VLFPVSFSAFQAAPHNIGEVANRFIAVHIQLPRWYQLSSSFTSAQNNLLSFVVAFS
jgi:hypothetical protein